MSVETVEAERLNPSRMLESYEQFSNLDADAILEIGIMQIGFIEPYGGELYDERLSPEVGLVFRVVSPKTGEVLFESSAHYSSFTSKSPRLPGKRLLGPDEHIFENVAAVEQNPEDALNKLNFAIKGATEYIAKLLVYDVWSLLQYSGPGVTAIEEPSVARQAGELVTSNQVTTLSNLSGQYSSEVTETGDSGNYYKRLFESNITLSQLDESSLRGTFGKSGKIWGRIEGDTIKFDWFADRGQTGVGEWKSGADGAGLEGTWATSTRNSVGTWKIARVDGESIKLSTRTEQVQLSSDFDLSGIYTSSVVRKDNNDYFCFNQRKTFEIELKQDGREVEGSFRSGITGKITGTIEQDKVVFNWYTTKCNSDTKGSGPLSPMVRF